MTQIFKLPVHANRIPVDRMWRRKRLKKTSPRECIRCGVIKAVKDFCTHNKDLCVLCNGVRR